MSSVHDKIERHFVVCKVLSLVLIHILVLIITYNKDLKGRREIILTKSVHDIHPRTHHYSDRVQHWNSIPSWNTGKQAEKSNTAEQEGYTYRDKNNKLHDPGSGMIA